MPAADEVLVGVLASAAQVAHRLVLGRRRMHLGQKPGAEQLGQLAGVTTIGLDAIARLARDQRRCDHRAGAPSLLDPSL